MQGLLRRALPALVVGLGAPAWAQSPVSLVVGSPAGSAGDLWARGFAAFLERHWRDSAVTVLNRPGEGGLAAARLVAAASPEALLIGAVATPFLLARALERNEAALLDRLRFVAAVTEEPLLLLGHPGMAGDLAALRALGPGAILATPPAGTAAQLAGLALGQVAGLDLLAFASAAAARQAVLAGNVPCAVLAASESIAVVREGRLAALGVAQQARCPLVPEVPTLAEGGYRVSLVARRGFITCAAAAPTLVRPLLKALRASVADPELEAQAADDGYLPRFRDSVEWERALRSTVAGLMLGTLGSDGAHGSE